MAIATSWVGCPLLMAIVLLTMPFAHASDWTNTTCSNTDIRYTVNMDGNDVIVNGEARILPLTSVTGILIQTPSQLDPDGISATLHADVRQVVATGEDTILARCDDGSSCTGGPVDLELWADKANKLIRVEINGTLEDAEFRCQFAKTITFDMGGVDRVSGPSFIMINDAFQATIYWTLPVDVHHVDIICCGDDVGCSKTVMKPGVNPTRMTLPVGGSLYQFDFYIHRSDGEVFGISRDPNYAVMLGEAAPEAEPEDVMPIGISVPGIVFCVIIGLAIVGGLVFIFVCRYKEKKKLKKGGYRSVAGDVKSVASGSKSVERLKTDNPSSMEMGFLKYDASRPLLPTEDESVSQGSKHSDSPLDVPKVKADDTSGSSSNKDSSSHVVQLPERRSSSGTDSSSDDADSLPRDNTKDEVDVEARTPSPTPPELPPRLSPVSEVPREEEPRPVGAGAGPLAGADVQVVADGATAAEPPIETKSATSDENDHQGGDATVETAIDKEKKKIARQDKAESSDSLVNYFEHLPEPEKHGVMGEDKKC